MKAVDEYFAVALVIAYYKGVSNLNLWIKYPQVWFIKWTFSFFPLETWEFYFFHLNLARSGIKKILERNSLSESRPFNYYSLWTCPYTISFTLPWTWPETACKNLDDKSSISGCSHILESFSVSLNKHCVFSIMNLASKRIKNTRRGIPDLGCFLVLHVENIIG